MRRRKEVALSAHVETKENKKGPGWGLICEAETTCLAILQDEEHACITRLCTPQEADTQKARDARADEFQKMMKYNAWDQTPREWAWLANSHPRHTVSAAHMITSIKGIAETNSQVKFRPGSLSTATAYGKQTVARPQRHQKTACGLRCQALKVQG